MVCLRKVVLLEERAVTPALGRWSPVSGITLGRQEEVGLPPPGGVRAARSLPPAAPTRSRPEGRTLGRSVPTLVAS